MATKDYSEFQKKDFINLITKLNTKVIFLQRQKSMNGFQGKTEGYKAKVCKDMVLKFIHKGCKHPLDEAPSIKDVKVFDFWKWLSRLDPQTGERD